MTGAGGARPGAGRPKGSVTRRHVDALASIMEGKSPAEYLAAVMRDENADQKRRDWAAEKLAAYVHARPAPLQRTIEIELPDTNTPAGITSALAAITQAVSHGEIAPAEAHSLAALIETQRKAIETEDMMRRLEVLEAATRR